MNEQISGFTYYFPYHHVAGSYRSLAIARRADPNLPATLYVGVNYATADSFGYEFVWDEVFASTDGGSGAAPLLPYSGDPWAFPAWRTTQVLAFAAPTATTPATVYTSGFYEYDACFLWTEAAAIGCAVLGNTFAGGASALAVDPQSANTVYAGTNGSGVYKSTNGGAGWSGGGTGAVKSLAVDPHTPAIIYAGTDDLGVLKSTDGGMTWSAVNTGLTSYIEALGLHPGIRVVAVDPLVPTTVYAGTVAGVFKSTDAGGSWSLTGHPTLVSVRVNPGIVIRGTASTGTAILNAAAPEGAVITLSSDNAAVANLPGSVAVAPGAMSADFAISTGPVSGVATVTISATHDDLVRSAALYVVPALKYAVVSPYRVPGGIGSTATLGLSLPAPAGGAVVSLSSSDPAVAAVPAAVTVAAGATNASFAVSTSAVAVSTTVTITMAYGGDTRSVVLDLVPTTVSSLSLNPASVTAGSTSIGTVTLSVPAPAGGAVVTLSTSGRASVTVPASVTVAAGTTSATFTISTSSVLPPTYSSTTASIQAANGGATASRGLVVTRRP
jgi:hypothetical protein